MHFVFTPIAASEVSVLFGLSADALGQRGAMRLAAPDGAPCRLTLQDAEPGEPLLLLNYVHQPAGLYRGSGPIFVREGASSVSPRTEVPESFRGRLYSARGYAADGWMVDAEVIEGEALETGLHRLFEDDRIAYVHLHHARRGCFACRVDRA